MGEARERERIIPLQPEDEIVGRKGDRENSIGFDTNEIGYERLRAEGIKR